MDTYNRNNINSRRPGQAKNSNHQAGPNRPRRQAPASDAAVERSRNPYSQSSRSSRPARPEGARPSGPRPDGTRPNPQRPNGQRTNPSRPNGQGPEATRRREADSRRQGPNPNRPSGNHPNRPNGNHPNGPRNPRPSGQRRPGANPSMPTRREPVREEAKKPINYAAIFCIAVVVIVIIIIALILKKGNKKPVNQPSTVTPVATQAVTSDSPTPSPSPSPTPFPNPYTVLYEDYIDVQLLTPNEFSRPQISLDEVKSIVIHYVGNPGTTAQNNRDYFEKLGTTGETKASSHFVVGLEGEIIQCIPLNEYAYASNFRNADSISIEVCHPDEDGKFNDATYDSVCKLTNKLINLYGIADNDDCIIRHYDVKGKICPKYYVEHEDAWVQLKSDCINYGK